ncbi:MAG: hypothetical protein RMI94_03440 [Bryobacterales bacterium]|nr:hypothetical protein [Bryobacteraceae bacterium]MDW8129577.1 hypothetical protein [Bryobacterales bacterium]
MRNRTLLGLLAAACAWAQTGVPRSPSTLKVNFPRDAPVALVEADWGESRELARGSALVLDLHTSLTLRNLGLRNIRGITLLVAAQALTPGGKASVSVPGLDVKPGETFPVRLDLRLLRPAAVSGPLVELELDGVLFDDLSFYGANRLNSRRLMTVWELEARRDRRYYRQILEVGGPEELRRHMLEILAERPRLDVQVSRGQSARGSGRATAVTARAIEIACLQLPGAPLELVRGEALVSGSETRSPRVEVLNRSRRPIRYFEVAWLLRDRQGREYLAGTIPGRLAGVLAPGARAEAVEAASLRFAQSGGQPLAVEALTGVVTQAEFADGEIWIPESRVLEDARLRRLLPPSAEEQRLAEIYRRHGLAAVIEELKKR